jgi:maltose alpha-D-glucosyltransferase/alpha-amylase
LLAQTIGRRTAELHLIMSQETSDPAFTPEPFDDFYRQSLYHSYVGLTSRRFEFLRQHYSDMAEDVRILAAKVLEQEDAIVSRFRAIFDQRVRSMRTGYHGRLHLGHLLVRNDDVIMFDFEGDPDLHLSERRIKRCPLRDVAGMLLSFGYAAQSSLRQLVSAERNELAALQRLRVWARFWYSHVSAAFLRGYWRTAKKAPYLPDSVDHQQLLLTTNLLERALLDIRAEITEKRDLAGMPLRIILHLLDAEAERRM